MQLDKNFDESFKFPKYSRWTRSAKDCYFLGCICSLCPVYQIIGKKCRMKQTVLALVRKLGKPNKEENETSD